MSAGHEGRIFVAPLGSGFGDDSAWQAIGMVDEASPFGFPTQPDVPLTIRIRGKRIWWKPWKRRPDTTHYFPHTRIEHQPDGSFTVTAVRPQGGAS